MLLIMIIFGRITHPLKMGEGACFHPPTAFWQSGKIIDHRVHNSSP
jgi:hypothetical protein